MEDITKTGPVGLKGLNRTTNNEKQYFLRSLQGASGKQLNNALLAPAEIDVGNYAAQVGYGNSIYDEAVSNISNFADINDIRGQEQPWYAQLGAGLVKGVSLAATTFIDGTAGLLYGIGAAGVAAFDDKYSASEAFAKLWDNDVSNALQDWNNAMEEWLPNYRTEEELNNAWYQNLGTMNFWADNVLKNVGFTVGAFYSGGVFTKGLKAIKFLKGGMGAQVLGSVYSAVNEGRIEANNNSDDWEKLERQKIDDAFLTKLEDAGITVSSEEELAAYKAADPLYQKQIADLADRKAMMGLTDFIGNTVLLSLDNMYSYGKLYKRGFENAKTIAQKRVTKNAFNEGLEQAAREADDVMGGIVKDGAEYSFKKITKKQALGRGLKIGLVEGNEEMAQAMLSEFSGNMQSADSPDAYYEAMTNPDAELKTQNMLTSVTKAFANTYGNGDRWEEFAVGALTGLFGMPTFGKVANSDANTWIGRGKKFGVSGGLFGEFGNANRINAEGQEAVDYMNSYLRKLQDQERHFVQSQSFTDAMDGYAEAGDAFEYKNAEDNEDFAAISRFAKVGRLDDLRDIVKQDFEGIDDAELEKIAKFTSPQDTASDPNETPIGGWRNTDGTYMSDTESGRQEMRRELSKKRDKILGEIDRYEKSVRQVRAVGNNSLTEDQVNELAWLDWKVGKFDERFQNIKQDNADAFLRFSNALLDFRDSIDENSKEGKQWLKSVNSLIDFMSYLQGAKSSLSLASRIAANMNIVEALQNEDMYDIYLGESGMSYTDFTRMMNNLKDAGKLAMAAKTFNDRLQEFTKDPIKIIQNREKIDEKVAEAKVAKQKRDVADKVEAANVSELVKAAREGDDLDDIFDALPEDADEAQDDLDEARRINEENSNRSKVKEAKNIVTSADALTGNNGKGGIIDRVEGTDQAKKDAATLLRKSEEVAETEDELLDLTREVFNDPGSLDIEEFELQQLANQGLSQDEILQYAQDRLDAARAVLNDAFGDLDEAKKDLSDLQAGPKRKLREVTEPQSTDTGHDATTKGETMTPSEKAKKQVEEANLTDNMDDALEGLESGNPLEVAEEEADEDRITTPPITAQDVQSSINKMISFDFSKDETQKENYWKPTTTRVSIHRERGDDRPFYEIAKTLKNNDGSPRYSDAQLQRMEAVHKHLSRVGAFDRVDSGKVKAGDVVKFRIDKALNDDAGDIVILITDSQGNVIGDLMSKQDLGTSSVNRGMLTFVEKLEDEYAKANSPQTMNFNYTSHVGKMMVGKAPFTSIDKQHTLNEIAAEQSTSNGVTTTIGEPLLGIAMSDGSNSNILIEPGRKKAQGQSAREMATISPLSAKAGEPFLLIETSSERRKYLPIPFNMPTFNSTTVASGLGMQINKLIQRLTSAQEKELLSIKDEIKELLAVNDIFFNLKDNNLRIVIKVWGAQLTVFNGDRTNATDAIARSLYFIPFQISRKYINGQLNGLRYNLLIGELAKTNLPIGGNHTISDWFTINPIDANGKEIKAKNPKTTGVNPEASSNTVKVQAGNGKIYSVDIRNWEVLDSEGKAHDTKQESAPWNAIRAVAYGLHNNKSLEAPFETPWGWYDPKTGKFTAKPSNDTTVITEGIKAVGEGLRDNSAAFSKQREQDVLNWLKRPKVTAAIDSYIEQAINAGIIEIEAKDLINKMIENESTNEVKVALQDVIRFESTMKYVSERLKEQVPKVDKKAEETQGPEDNTKTTSEIDSVEISTEKVKKARLLGSKKRKELWEVLTQEQKHTIANDIVHQDQWMRLLENAFIPKTKTFIEKLLKGSVDSLLGKEPLNRKAATVDAGSITKSERKWFDKNLPKLNSEDRLRFVNSIIVMTKSGNPVTAWGQFSDGVITIADDAARGTLYHEAFHSVVHTLLTEEEYSDLYDAAKAKYGDYSALALEEKLAEDFRRYMQVRETPVLGTIVRMFQTLKRFINNLRGKKLAIDSLFYRISSGQLASRTPKEVSGVTRNMMTSAQERAKQIFFDEVWGKDLNDWDIVRINRELELLSRTIDSTVWHLRPSRKGGYYIAGYRNRPVIMEDYWSPGLWSSTMYRLAEVQQYHRDKYAVGNLTDDQQDYLDQRGVTPEEFSTWSTEAKDIFFRCM